MINNIEKLIQEHNDYQQSILKKYCEKYNIDESDSQYIIDIYDSYIFEFLSPNLKEYVELYYKMEDTMDKLYSKLNILKKLTYK